MPGFLGKENFYTAPNSTAVHVCQCHLIHACYCYLFPLASSRAIVRCKLFPPEGVSVISKEEGSHISAGT